MRRSPASTRSSRTCASSTRSTMSRASASRAGHQHDLFGAMSRGERRAHQAAEQAQDQRHHRQSALQRQPAERERQQQEPRISARSTSASRQTYITAVDGAEDQALRHVCALLSLGIGPDARRTASSPSSPTAALSTAAPSTAFARWWRRSSAKSTSSISAATCAPIRNSPARSTMSSASRPALRSASV